MSEENVETVRRAWDAWLGDDLDALFACFDADTVYDLKHFREWPDHTYRGIDGVRHFLTEWLSLWTDSEAGVDQILAAPDDRVVVLTRQRGKGRESGLPMSMEWAQLISVRNGKITRVDAYDDRQEALEAAGLSAPPSDPRTTDD